MTIQLCSSLILALEHLAFLSSFGKSQLAVNVLRIIFKLITTTLYKNKLTYLSFNFSNFLNYRHFLYEFVNLNKCFYKDIRTQKKLSKLTIPSNAKLSLNTDTSYQINVCFFLISLFMLLTGEKTSEAQYFGKP